MSIWLSALITFALRGFGFVLWLIFRTLGWSGSGWFWADIFRRSVALAPVLSPGLSSAKCLLPGYLRDREVRGRLPRWFVRRCLTRGASCPGTARSRVCRGFDESRARCLSAARGGQ